MQSLALATSRIVSPLVAAAGVLDAIGDGPILFDVAVVGLLVGLAIGLSRMPAHLDDQHTPH